MVYTSPDANFIQLDAYSTFTFLIVFGLVIPPSYCEHCAVCVQAACKPNSQDHNLPDFGAPIIGLKQRDQLAITWPRGSTGAIQNYHMESTYPQIQDSQGISSWCGYSLPASTPLHLSQDRGLNATTDQYYGNMSTREKVSPPQVRRPEHLTDDVLQWISQLSCSHGHRIELPQEDPPARPEDLTAPDPINFTRPTGFNLGAGSPHNQASKLTLSLIDRS